MNPEEQTGAPDLLDPFSPPETPAPQQKKKDKGWVTETMEFLEENFDPLNYLDKTADKLAERSGGDPFFQTIADVIPSRDESKEQLADIPVVGKPAVAIGSGIDQGVALMGPTPLATLTNQDAPWNERPTVLKDEDWFSNLLYETTKIVTPGLLTRGLGFGNVLLNDAGSSAVETLSQDSMDDLIYGRTLADKYGQIWGTITGNPEAGKQLTVDLIEGNKGSVQPFIKVNAFLHNYAINVGFGKLLEIGGPIVKNIVKNVADRAGNLEIIAKRTGKSTDQVAQEMTDMPQPPYTSELEPHEAVTVESTRLNPTNKDTNEPALLNRVLADAAGTDVDLDDPSRYFYDWSRLGSTEEIQVQIAEAFKGKQPIELGSVQYARMLRNAATFISDNKEALQVQDTIALQELAEYGGFRDTNIGSATARDIAEMKQADFVKYFENYYELDLNTEEGFTGILISRYLAEQGGRNLANVADQIGLLKSKGLPYDELVNNVLIPNQRFIRAALSPFRRGQRAFYMTGVSQQDKTLRSLQSALGEEQIPVKNIIGDEPDLTKKPGQLTIDGETVKIKVAGEEVTLDSIEQVWRMASGGNEEAREIFELAMDNIRFGDPEKVLANMKLQSDIIKTALQEKKGFERYFYNVVALGQLGTQTNAAGATVFRQSLEPVALTLAKGAEAIARGPFNGPAAMSAAKDAMYGIGMFFGGLQSLGASSRAMFHSFRTNVPASGKDRFTDSYSTNVLRELTEIKNLHGREYEKLKAEGGNPFEFAAQFIGHRAREFSYSTTANLPTRALMAQDEAAKVTTANQHAYARALVETMFQKDIRPGQVQAQFKLEQQKIFKGEPWRGEIIDPEIKAASERATLQESFDIGPDSNPVERLFASQAEANKMSPITRLFNAFPRPAYRQIEQEWIENVGMTIIPSPLYKKLNKKIRNIFNNADPTQRLQLEGQKSLALAIGMAGTAITVYNKLNSEQTPEVQILGDKIIVDGEDYDTAFEMGKFSPSTVWLGIIGNITDAFFEGKTSEAALSDQLLTVVQATFADIVNRNMLAGQQQFSRLVNVESSSWGENVADWLFQFISPGVVKEIAGILQPYETVREVNTDVASGILSRINRNTFASASTPIQYDVYSPYSFELYSTGKPKAGNERYDPRLSYLASLFYPGKIQPVRVNDPVQKMLRQNGFELKRTYTQEIAGVQLTAEQQSELSKAIMGRLYDNLDRYRRSTSYKKLRDQLAKATKTYGQDHVTTQQIRMKINNALVQEHNASKDEAFVNSSLVDDPILSEAYEQLQVDTEEFNQSSLSPERQGLYAQAAKQNTPFANQVREILEFPA